MTNELPHPKSETIPYLWEPQLHQGSENARFALCGPASVSSTGTLGGEKRDKRQTEKKLDLAFLARKPRY